MGEQNFMTYNGNHLFHYTRFESALKIISSRKLLFGDFRNVNDISESRRDVIGDYYTAKKELNMYKAICFIMGSSDMSVLKYKDIGLKLNPQNWN